MSNPSPSHLREATKRGARLLDQMLPGWHKRMRPEHLDMSSTSLCALGQLFGTDVEMSIGKEMFPEEWNKHFIRKRTGYGVGKELITIWSSDKDAETLKNAEFLRIACAGYDTQCFWAEEVAERLVNDEVQNERDGNSPTA